MMKVTELTRQRENFLVLLNNYSKALEAQGIAANSSGLAQERYQKYLEGVEAAQNRLTAAWEGMWAKTLSSGIITFLLNVQAGIFSIIESMGGLIPILSIILGLVIAIKSVDIAAGIGVIVSGLVKLVGILKNIPAMITAISTSFSLANAVATFGIGLLATAIAAVVVNLASASEATEDFNFKVSELNSNISQISSNLKSVTELTNELYRLNLETSRTSEEQQKWYDIQNQLKQILPEINGQYDEMGNFIIDETVALKSLVDLKKEELRLEQEKLKLELQSKVQQEIQDYKDKAEALREVTGQYKIYQDLEAARKAGTLQEGQDVILAGYDFEEQAKNIANLRYEQAMLLNQLKTDFLSLDDEFKNRIINNFRNVTLVDKVLVSTLKELMGMTEEATSSSLDFKNQLMAVFQSTGRTEFRDLANQLISLNDSFKDGKLQTKEYFELLNAELSDLDFEKLFGGGASGMAGGQQFFSTMTQNISGALNDLNKSFSEGAISLPDYTEQVSGLGEAYQNLGQTLIENAQSVGMNAEQLEALKNSVSSSSETIEQAQEELETLQETNNLLFSTWQSLGEGSLQQGSEDYQAALQQIAVEAYDSMNQVGAALTDANGKILESSDAVYQYMSGGLTNFQTISDQVAGKTGNTVSKMTNAIGILLDALATDIGNFKMSLNIDLSHLTFQDLGIGGLKIPFGSIDIEGSSSSFAATSQALHQLAQIFIEEDASKWTSSLYRVGDAAKSAADSLGGTASSQSKVNEAVEAYDDLLKDVIAMLKQRKEDEKKALQEELEGYKKIIDAKKKIIEQEREEEKYKDKLSEKNKEIAEIQNELLQMQYDTSEEANARRLTLQEQLAEKQKDLADTQADHEVDVRTEALDNEYDRFKEIIDEKIAIIDDYLSKTGAIQAEAIALLEERSVQLYQALIAWNKLYGTGIDSDITDKWNLATGAFQKYKDAVTNGIGSSGGNPIGNAIKNATDALGDIFNPKTGGGGGGNKIANIYHSGGWVGGVPTLESNEVYAKLMKGEYVSTQDDIYYFMNRTLPTIVANSDAGSLNSEINFYVTGNMDKSLIPQIEQMVFSALNNAKKQKGKFTNAFAYSI